MIVLALEITLASLLWLAIVFSGIVNATRDTGGFLVAVMMIFYANMFFYILGTRTKDSELKAFSLTLFGIGMIPVILSLVLLIASAVSGKPYIAIVFQKLFQTTSSLVGGKQ